mmetsp:Transcript_8387/g.23977  ORF Transcript_8387/g.23977 Transcript_8387/m.23977 type:complete len:207 (-) Transcript_8387:130-750(-)
MAIDGHRMLREQRNVIGAVAAGRGVPQMAARCDQCGAAGLDEVAQHEEDLHRLRVVGVHRESASPVHLCRMTAERVVDMQLLVAQPMDQLEVIHASILRADCDGVIAPDVPRPQEFRQVLLHLAGDRLQDPSEDLVALQEVEDAARAHLGVVRHRPRDLLQDSARALDVLAAQRRRHRAIAQAQELRAIRKSCRTELVPALRRCSI